MTRRLNRRKKKKLLKKVHLYSTLLLWLSLIAIIFILPPSQSWRIGLLFGLMFLSLVSTLFIISSAVVFNLVFTFGVLLTLFLQYIRQLSWLNGGLLLLFCFVTFFTIRKLKS
jgi:hypothetical protein